MACYNEVGNISALLDAIVAVAPTADILVVDDSSPDGTWEVLQDKRRQYIQLTTVRRPRKLGVGSAHKYGVRYAIREGYDLLLTMDADFSHDPKYIPAILAEAGPNIFVTGSRYCEGGSCDYTGYRNFVSRAGNVAARLALGLNLKEYTTFFRALDVQSLRALPLRELKSSGYAYGVQLIFLLWRNGVALKEVPIHFADRVHGRSKIPKVQIIRSAVDLGRLAFQRLFRRKPGTPERLVPDACAICGDRVLVGKYAASRRAETTSDARAFRCTSVGTSRSIPAVYVCLACGHQQVPPSQIPECLETLYADVVDETYLRNLAAREKTFRRSLRRIDEWFPDKGSMLDVGAFCGLFVREAIDHGWTAEGVEPSRWAADYARRQMGVRVFDGYLAANRARLQPTYDAVVSWDVLEHVRDPLAFVKECGGFLQPGGMFCFSSLDVDTWFPRLLGRRWPWLMEMHLHYFDRHGIRHLLDLAGFDLVAAETYPHYASLPYIFERGIGAIAPALAPAARSIAKLVPRWTLAVSFGDVKLYAARKRA